MDKRTKDFILAVGIMLAAYFLAVYESDSSATISCTPPQICKDKTP
jgi:hypothetical protein